MTQIGAKKWCSVLTSTLKNYQNLQETKIYQKPGKISQVNCDAKIRTWPYAEMLHSLQRLNLDFSVLVVDAVLRSRWLAILVRVHFLHRRWVDDGHRHGDIIGEVSLHFAVLLADCTPMHAAVDRARIARRVLRYAGKVNH